MMLFLILLVVMAVGIVLLRIRFARFLDTGNDTGGDWYFRRVAESERIEADRRREERTDHPEWDGSVWSDHTDLDMFDDRIGGSFDPYEPVPGELDYPGPGLRD